MRILVVEDEITLCETIAKGLRLDGYEVDTCFDGGIAWNMAMDESYDLIILDLNLPVMDGMEVLRNIRKEDSETAVLILSARGHLQDKIDGLDSGANDYLCKPFHFEELEARVRSLTRRRTVQNNVILSCGELSLDTKSRTVMARGEKLPLTRKELGLLEYLLLHQERPVPQEELIQHVWGEDLAEAGIAVQLLEGVDNLEAILEVFGPTDTARAGILVDHMVPGSKESRIAEAVSARWPGAVLVLGHPFIDIWQAVKPARVGLERWPDVPRGIDIKHGTLEVLGWPHADQRDIAMGWKRILSTVRTYRDLEPELLGRVEELIDFVTVPWAQ